MKRVRDCLREENCKNIKKELKVLEFLNSNPQKTAKEISEKIGYSDNMIKFLLKPYVKDGVVDRVRTEEGDIFSLKPLKLEEEN